MCAYMIRTNAPTPLLISQHNREIVNPDTTIRMIDGKTTTIREYVALMSGHDSTELLTPNTNVITCMAVTNACADLDNSTLANRNTIIVMSQRQFPTDMPTSHTHIHTSSGAWTYP